MYFYGHDTNNNPNQTGPIPPDQPPLSARQSSQWHGTTQQLKLNPERIEVEIERERAEWEEEEYWRRIGRRAAGAESD